MAFLSDIRRAARPQSRRRTPLSDMLSLYRQRRHLARLDNRALADLGLTRDEAQAEARRPIWDVPQHWLK